MSRRVPAALVVALLALTPLTLGAAPVAAAEVDAGAEASFVARTNALRAGEGLPPLEVHGALVAKARAWAETMAAEGGIRHSHLPDGAPSGWRRLGENVGRGPGVDAVHQALVASPSHHKNLVDPGFRYVGVGVVNAEGTIYVAEVFMEPASQPAPWTSSSTAGTPTSAPPRSAPGPTARAVPAPEPPPPPEPAPRLTAVLARLRALDG